MNVSVDEERLSHFRQFPVIGVPLLILMALVTLGVYAWWWMYSRSLLLNNELPEGQRIDKGFMHLCIGGFVVTLVLAVASGMQQDNAAIEATLNVVSLLLNIMVIAWTLLLRRGVNLLLGEQNRAFHMNIFWLVLFQVIYMQYKINRIREHSQIGVM